MKSQTDPESQNVRLQKMDIPESEKKKVIIKELVQGQEAATQLKFLLENPFGANGSISSEELATNVLRSFTQALSIASQPDYQNLLNPGENGSPVLASGNDPPSGDSTSEMRSLPARKSARGCYKRRKSAQTWAIVSRTSDDNHAWRKYGQKEIMNYEFPRSYYRCTHKFDQGCLATKQVQKTQENPDMYQITYTGIHTCNATPKETTHLVSSDYPTTPPLETALVNSSDPEHPKVPSEQDHQHIIRSPSPTIKQEYYPKEDTTTNIVTDQKAAIMPLKVESDNIADAAVYSSTGSDQSLALDLGVESVHLDIDFHLDESHQLLRWFDNYNV